jgi:phage RecT family recombinase
VVEVFGFKVLYGLVGEQDVAGVKFVRIESLTVRRVAEDETEDLWETCLYNPAAVFSIRPRSELMTSTDVVRQQVQEAALAGGGDGQTVFDLINASSRRIDDAALPKHLDRRPVRPHRADLVRKTPKLAECEPMSFVGALMVSAQLGLEPGPPLGLSWIIPRYNSKTRKLEAQFQIRLQGRHRAVPQSGQFVSIQARAVCENDEFSYSYGLDDDLIHRPLLKGDRGESYAWYAIAKFKDGGHAFVVLNRARGREAPRPRPGRSGVGPTTTRWPASRACGRWRRGCRCRPSLRRR